MQCRTGGFRWFAAQGGSARRLAPVQLGSQHFEVVVSPRLDELKAVFAALDEETVAGFQIEIVLAIKRGLCWCGIALAQYDFDAAPCAHDDGPVAQRVRTNRHQYD